MCASGELLQHATHNSKLLPLNVVYLQGPLRKYIFFEVLSKPKYLIHWHHDQMIMIAWVLCVVFFAGTSCMCLASFFEKEFEC